MENKDFGKFREIDYKENKELLEYIELEVRKIYEIWIIR